MEIKMTKILAIAGRKGSGKTTATNFLFGMEMLSLDQPRMIDYFKINENGKLVVPSKYEDGIRDGVFDPITPNPEITEFLMENIWPYIKTYNFADSLKQLICINLLGLSWEQCYGTDEEKNSMTTYRWENMPGVVCTDELSAQSIKMLKARQELTLHSSGFMSAREVMQYVGTEMFRKMYSNVWIDNCINRINIENSELAVVGDCRFPNEVEAIQQAGGKVIYLTRNPYNDDHESETALDGYRGFDGVVDNAQMSIAEQNQAVYALLKEWEYINHEMTHQEGAYTA